MNFKIGDKVAIHDGSWAVLVDKKGYHKETSFHQVQKSGTVVAVNCRLPFGRSEKNTNPIEGVVFGAGHVHNDLLVSIDGGLVFTSTRHVRLCRPHKPFVRVYGVKIEITEEQYKGIYATGKPYSGVFSKHLCGIVLNKGK